MWTGQITAYLFGIAKEGFISLGHSSQLLSGLHLKCIQDFVSPIKGCLEADTVLFCGLPQAHSMNHADDILAELITLLDVSYAGLGDIYESIFAA